eukprot:2936504-Prymnesium_polylepis.1
MDGLQSAATCVHFAGGGTAGCVCDCHCVRSTCVFDRAIPIVAGTARLHRLAHATTERSDVPIRVRV